jgi:AraC-like DNA-binding protein
VFHELGFVIEGDCDWHVDGRCEHLHAGDLLLVPAGCNHREETPGAASARLGWIGFDFADGHADMPAALCAPVSAREYETEFRRLFDVVCAERQGTEAGHVERAEFALREIIILLCRLRPAGPSGAPGKTAKKARAPQLVQSAALTLTGNLAHPMRIRDLAHYHSLSTSHFALLFRKHQGETPSRYLQKARLNQVKALLEDGGLTVKEIAAACGYVDAAHLCHAFKAATRITPKQFRQRAKARA